MQPGAEPSPYRSRLKADSNFFLELQYCYENGLPHSQFLAWDEADRAKMLAFHLEKGERCYLCGTAPWEWDPEKGGSRFAYEAVVVDCHGCYVKESVARDMNDVPGSTVQLMPTAGREAAQRHVAARRAYGKRSAS